MATYEPKIVKVESTTSVQNRIKAGRELVKQGRLDEALAEFEAILKLDPNSKGAHLAIGSIKARQDRLDDALREFKEVLRIDPMNIQAHLRTARVLISKKDLKTAQEYVESALRIDPKSPVSHLFAGYLSLMRKDSAQAREHLTKALTYNPRLVRARLQMAAVLRNEGKIPEALAQINAAVRIDPDSASVHDALGKLHLVRKDFSGARESFEKAMSLQGENDSDARIGLVEALIEEGDLDRAEEIMRQAPSRLEGRPGFHKIWGDLYERRRLYQEAVEEYRAAQVLATKDSEEPAAPAPELPAADDLAAWKKLAGELRAVTDDYRDKARLQLVPTSLEIDE